MGNGALPNGPSYRAHPRLYYDRGIAQGSVLDTERGEGAMPQWMVGASCLSVVRARVVSIGAS